MTIHSEAHCLCGATQGNEATRLDEDGNRRHRGWCPSHPVQLARREAGMKPAARLNWPGIHVPQCSYQFRRDLRIAYPDQREREGSIEQDHGVEILNALGRLERSSLGVAIAHLESTTWGWPATEDQLRRARRYFDRGDMHAYYGVE